MKMSVRVFAGVVGSCCMIVMGGCSKDSSGAAAAPSASTSATTAPAGDSAQAPQAMAAQNMDGRPHMERGDGGAMMGGGDFHGRHDERGGEHERH